MLRCIRKDQAPGFPEHFPKTNKKMNNVKTRNSSRKRKAVENRPRSASTRNSRKAPYNNRIVEFPIIIIFSKHQHPHTRKKKKKSCYTWKEKPNNLS